MNMNMNNNNNNSECRITHHVVIKVGFSIKLLPALCRRPRWAQWCKQCKRVVN